MPSHPYTPIPKIVVHAESNKQEADDRKGHWDFLLIHLFIRRYFNNMHFQMAEQFQMIAFQRS